MAWISHSPRNVRAVVNSEIVKIGFYHKKNKAKATLSCFLGSKVAARCGFQAGDSVEFLFDAINKRRLLIRKVSDKKAGYTLFPILNKNQELLFLKTVITAWLTEDELQPEDFKIRFVDYWVTPDGVIIDASINNKDENTAIE